METIPVFERRKMMRRTPLSMIGVAVSRLEKQKEVWAILNDYCENGVGISSPVEFPEGTVLDLTINNSDEKELNGLKYIIGKVCWCKRDSIIRNTYNLGIETHGQANGHNIVW